MHNSHFASPAEQAGEGAAHSRGGGRDAVNRLKHVKLPKYVAS